MPDFGVNTDRMGDAIDSLRSTNDSMSGLNDQIKNVILTKLAEEGIRGEQAETIADKYMETVAKPTEEFMERNETYIKQTESAKTSFEENNQKTQNILNNLN